MSNLTKILVFDDEEDTEDLFQQAFRHQIADGIYEFFFATSMEKTNELLESGKPDIFLTDINVNGVDGIQLISQLKKDYPKIKSVVISAYGDMNTLRSVMRAGAHDFVIKPIDLKDLTKTLEKTAKAVEKMKAAEATSQKLTAISNELDVSAQLQKSLLPGNVVKKGNIDLYAENISAAECSGDFYDFFWLSETKLGIVIADVSGKNVSAAMFSIIAKTLIKAYSRVYASPAECFKNVNVSICGENVATMFVTAMYGVIDMETNELTYTNAGHLPVALVRAGEDPVFLECDSGMALGIWDETEFLDNVHKFEPGDTVVFYTDGVNEAASATGEEYDYERFTAALKANETASPKSLSEEIVKDIRKFTVGAPQSDDITIMCVKYRLRITPNAD